MIKQLEVENKLLRQKLNGFSRKVDSNAALFSMIQKIGLALMYKSNFKLACQTILDIIIKSTIAQNCSIMLVDSEKNQLFLIAATDPDHKSYTIEAKDVFSKDGIRYSFRVGEGAAGSAIREKKTVLIYDTEASAIYSPDAEAKVKIGSLLSVPLIIKDEIIGVLNLSHADKSAFEIKELHLFNIVSNFVALSLQGTLNYEKLQYSKEKANKELEAKVEERTIELITTNKQLLNEVFERKQVENKIKESLKEKEVLLREVHHRVKNNMQIISSILNLQVESIEDLRALQMIKECQNRIKSMALFHENLYQSVDLVKIDYGEYIMDLVDNLFRSFGIDQNKIAKKIDIGDISTGVDSAIPCGLVINELVSNALKYAFPEGKACNNSKQEIEVSLHSIENNMLELVVSDNGIGLSTDLDFRKTSSLGLQLVTMLVEGQLKGKIDLDRSQGGSKFKIEFKERKNGSSLNLV